jgi:hypothetical protein
MKPISTRHRERLEGAAFALSSAALASAACLFPFAAIAAGNPPATIEAPLADPYVPPRALPKVLVPAAPPTEGAALRAQVERKLAQAFAAADVMRTGSLTREQARAAGLGYVVRNFDAIDRPKSGIVRFDDVKRFLRERGAAID